MRTYKALTLSLFVVGCAANGAPTGGNSVCDQATNIVAECLGIPPTPPAEGCVASYREAAELIVREGCSALDDVEGKFDEGGFFCQPNNLWLGRCTAVPLAEAGKVDELDKVCPASRTDVLCTSMRNTKFDIARDEVRRRFAAEGRGTALQDDAIKYYIRERGLALLAWNVITDRGANPSVSSDYWQRADDVLAEHYPAYAPGTMTMARFAMAPKMPTRRCTKPTEAILYFPGVARLGKRDEFNRQKEALEAAFPCVRVARVETGSFVDPGVNAQQGLKKIAEIDAELGTAVPLHMVGYSQGSSNALRTLVDSPGVAARTRSVITFNSAARGSEVGNLLYSLLTKAEAGCAGLPVLAQPTCESVAGHSFRVSDTLLDVIAKAQGVPTDDLQRFVEEEDAIAGAPTLADFMKAHLPGVRSLTTDAAAQFWLERGKDLPSNTLYMSFRSVITDSDRNLPSSNKMFHALLARQSAGMPYNDMQVRLVNMSLRVPSGIEIVGRVAEGNHWQWTLAEDSVQESIMPADMPHRTPDLELFVGYYQALHEAGVFLAE